MEGSIIMTRRGFMKLAAGLIGVLTSMSIPVPEDIKHRFSKKELADLAKSKGQPVYYLAV